MSVEPTGPSGIDLEPTTVEAPGRRIRNIEGHRAGVEDRDRSTTVSSLMNTCTITHVLVAAWVAGLLATSLSGSELIGWIAAVTIGLIVYSARLRGLTSGRGTCADTERSEGTNNDDY